MSEDVWCDKSFHVSHQSTGHVRPSRSRCTGSSSIDSTPFAPKTTFKKKTGANALVPILVEYEIAERVIDVLAAACGEHGRAIHFVFLHDMRMRADDDFRARINKTMG